MASLVVVSSLSRGCTPKKPWRASGFVVVRIPTAWRPAPSYPNAGLAHQEVAIMQRASSVQQADLHITRSVAIDIDLESVVARIEIL